MLQARTKSVAAPKKQWSGMDLAKLVPVDFFLPGCPPPAGRIKAVLQALLAGASLFSKGMRYDLDEAACGLLMMRQTSAGERVDLVE